MPATSPPTATSRAPYRDLRRTLRISTVEGSLYQTYAQLAGPGSIFLTKLALILGATPFGFGILAATGQLASLFQPLGHALTRRFTTRRPAVMWLAGLHRGLSMLFGALPFLLPAHIALWVFLGMVFVVMALLQMAVNAWTGWMADLLPIRIRGRFHAARNRWLMLVGFAVGFAVSAIVDALPNIDPIVGYTGYVADLTPDADTLLWGLLVVFVFGGVAGGIGVVVLGRQPERPKAPETGTSFWRQARDPFHDPNFRRLAVYTVWWMLAIGVASSYWQPYMLNDLRMSLVDAQIYGVISTVFAVATIGLWGRFIDRFGNKPTMRIALVMAFFNPIVWAFATPDTAWIIWIEGATNGIMWTANGLVTTNLVLAVAPKEKQQVYAGVLAAISGVAMMASTLLTAAITLPDVTVLGVTLGGVPLLFVLAGCARVSSQIPLTWVREPRSVPVTMALRRLLAHLPQRFRGKTVPGGVPTAYPNGVDRSRMPQEDDREDAP